MLKTSSISRVANDRLTPVVAQDDIEARGLLDGLHRKSRRERAELVEWLCARGFGMAHIRDSVAAPLLLPASRVLGDDGVYVSARQMCEETGIELPLLERLQRAMGLPRIDDADDAVLLRADGSAAARARFLLDLGRDSDDVVALMRVVMQSLAHVAAIMRETAVKTLLRPGATEVELAKAAE
jgi:adenylate cyclase